MSWKTCLAVLALFSGLAPLSVQAQPLAPPLTLSDAEGDLAVSQTDSEDPVLPGQTFSYVLAVTNFGQRLPLTGVVLTDLLPAGIAFVAGESDGKPSIPCQAAGPVICELGTLGPGETVTVTLTVVAVAGGTFSNFALVTAAGGALDPDPANNLSTEATRILGSALRVVVTPESQTVPAGGDAVFTITVRNFSELPLRDVIVAAPAVPSCNVSLGPLAPGRRRRFTCTAAAVEVSFTNKVTAVGIPEEGPPVSATATGRVEVKMLAPPRPDQR